MDTYAGNPGEDIITGSTSTTASANTLGEKDVINGGDGVDTLKLSMGKDFSGFTDGSLKSVEVIEATNATAATRFLTLTGSTDVTNLVINANSQSFTVNGLAAAGVDVQLNGLSGANERTVTINHATTATTGTADAITFGLNGVGVAQVKNATGVETTAEVKVNVRAAAIETVNLVATGAPNVVDAAIGTSTAMNISGSGSLKINAVDATLATVDASNASGALTLNLTDGAIKSYAGGSGVDSVTVDASIAANLTASGGEGADTLTIDTLDDGQTVRPTVSGFETISLKTTAAAAKSSTIAADRMTDVTTIRLPDDITTGETHTLAGLANETISIVQSEALAATFGTGAGTLAYTSAAAVALSTTTANTAQATFNTDFSLAAATSVDLAVGAKTKYTGDITANAATGVNVMIANGTAAAASEFSGTITSTSATSVTVNNQEDTTALVLTTVTKAATTLDVTSASAVSFGATSNLEKVSTATFTGDSSVDTATGVTGGVLGSKAASVTVDASQVLGAVTTTIGAYAAGGGAATVTGSELGANAVVIESGRTEVTVTGGISNDTVTLNSVLADTDAATVSINLGAVSTADTLILAGDGKAAVAHDWSTSTVTLSGVDVLSSDGATLTAKASTFSGQTLSIDKEFSAVTLNGTTGADVITVSKVALEDATATTITIDGGAGADTITGGAGADVIIGGAGVAVRDVMTGGAGADTFTIIAQTVGATTVDHITDFVGGTDKFKFGLAATFESITDDGTVAAAATLSAATTAAFVIATSDATAIEAIQFTYGGKKYFAIEAAIAGDATGAAVVEITGVTGTVVAGDFIA